MLINKTASKDQKIIQNAVENHPFRVITLFVCATILALGLYLLSQAWFGLSLEIKAVALVGCGLFAIASVSFIFWPACRKGNVQEKDASKKSEPIRVKSKEVVGMKTPPHQEVQQIKLQFSPVKRPLVRTPLPPSPLPAPVDAAGEHPFEIIDESYIAAIDGISSLNFEETFYALAPIINEHHKNPQAMDYIVDKYQGNSLLIAFLLINPLLPKGQEPDSSYSQLPHKHLLDALRKKPELLEEVMNHCLEKVSIPFYLWEKMKDEEADQLIALATRVPQVINRKSKPLFKKVWSLLDSLSLLSLDLSPFMNASNIAALRKHFYTRLAESHMELLAKAFGEAYSRAFSKLNQDQTLKEEYQRIQRDMIGEIKDPDRQKACLAEVDKVRSNPPKMSLDPKKRKLDLSHMKQIVKNRNNVRLASPRNDSFSPPRVLSSIPGSPSK